tara:strand:+ start:5564 stop:7267 length:1704 start_codon:yes stop_codon:yes gene_type:complete
MKKFHLSYFLPLILFCLGEAHAQDSFINPIIPGGFPDPSICRVGEDFYIVNSSFEYFPALPIHHSKDLINWELIGYGLNENIYNSSINLSDVQQEGGIHAPSIRYNNGLFYIVTTNVYSPLDIGKDAIMANFVITAKDPSGPWSEPHLILGAPGIDPDIFFDDNGKVYFVGTHAPGNKFKDGIGAIWVQELDLINWRLNGERYTIWEGACGGCCVEGPHIYKRNGNYYLVVAEGGTSFNHAVMISVSDSINGLYESNPKNPILTSRHLSSNNWVNSTGHADIVQLEDGRWVMVSLGVRNEIERSSNMGRETFLIPLKWEEAISRWVENDMGKWEPLIYDWPVAAPMTGKVERYNPVIFENTHQRVQNYFYDDFESLKLDLNWNFRRVPREKTYSLNVKKGFLRLYLKSQNFSSRKRYSLLGIRQKQTHFEFSTKMNFLPINNGEEAGLSLFQKDNIYINYSILKRDKGIVLSLYKSDKLGGVEILKEGFIGDFNGQLILKLNSEGAHYVFQCSKDDGETFEEFHKVKNHIILSQGYTGAYLGLYASSNGGEETSYADFDWCKYSDKR